MKSPGFFKTTFNWLLIVAVAYFICSLFSGWTTVDIHLHDTMYVITVKQLLWMIAAAYLFLWVLYKLTDRLLAFEPLKVLHIIISIIAPFIMVLIYSSYNGDIFLQGFVIMVLSVIFIMVQFSYLVNLLAGVFKRKDSQ